MEQAGPSGLICGRETVAAALDDPFHAPMHALLDYWGRRAEGGAMPRGALRPEELTALLPHLYLIDRVAPGRAARPGLDVRFRLVGTAIAQVEGELTGRRLSELIAPDEHPEVWEHYRRAFAGELCLRRQTLRWQEREHLRYEVLLLPMSRGGGAIDALLGMALYRFEGDEPLPPSGIRPVL